MEGSRALRELLVLLVGCTVAVYALDVAMAGAHAPWFQTLAVGVLAGVCAWCARLGRAVTR